MKIKLLLFALVPILLLFTFCNGNDLNTWALKHGEQKITKLVFLGDSLTAGYGLSNKTKSFPDLVAKQLNLPFQRFGFSGYKTSDALAKLPQIPEGKNALMVVTLGGNDILRNKPLSETEKNLKTIFSELHKKGYAIVYTEVLGLIGGKRHAMHLRVCQELQVAIVPDILAGVFSNPDLMQADSIHPAERGCQKIADKIVETINGLKLQL